MAAKYVQNTESRTIFIGGEVVLKPGYPKLIENFDDLCKLHPELQSKVDNGTIVFLTESEAKKEEKRINEEASKKMNRSA